MRSNKKGFTIVELVIVIAVIAILAAVLIPTIAGLVKKANISADQQAVVQMNKILAADASKPASTEDVVKILVKNGYNKTLNPYYAGHTLAWVASENTIVLVENGAIVYPEKLAGKTYTEIKEKIVASIDDVVLSSGSVVFVGSDFDAAAGITPEGAGDFELDLSGKTITAGADIGAWAEGQNFVVSNGTIDATESADSTAVYAGVGAAVELNNVQIYAGNGKNPIQNYGGTMVLNNVTTAQSGNADVSWYNSAIQVINKIVDNEETGKWAITSQANLTVNGGAYSGDKAILISAPGGNVTIGGGTFTGTTYVIQDDFAPQYYTDGANYESKIVINDGNFNGNLKITKDTQLVINGGTFVMAKITYFNAALNKNVTVDATWDVLSAFVADGATITLNGVEYTK